MSGRDSFRRRMTRLVKQRGTSISALAKLCDIPPATLHAWVTGAQPSDFEAVRCLAKELGVTFSYLLTGREDEHEGTKNSIHLDDLVSREELFEGFLEVSIRRIIPK